MEFCYHLILEERFFFVNLLCQEIFKKFSDPDLKLNCKKSWLKKTIQQKENLCKLAIKKFLANINELPNSIILNSIQNDINKMPIRIFISISESINSSQKSILIRNFEKFIKNEIDQSLQVLHEEKKDLNKIRRL